MKTIVQLCFGISTISNPSGMEKVFAELSNIAVKNGFNVIDICNDEAGKKPFYPLDEKVEFHNLSLGKIRVPFYKKLLREIAKILKLNIKNYVDEHRSKILASRVNEIIKNRQIYAIICYEHNAVFVANLLPRYAPKIAMLHNPVEELIEPLSARQLKEANKMDAYQVLMPSFVEKAKKYLTTKVVCIPNIAPKVDIQKPFGGDKNKRVIIHIGRIEKRQKRQHILVKAFAKIADKFPEWELHLYGAVGDRQYKKTIDEFIKERTLEQKILFKGLTQNSVFELSNADIFGFPSSYEGFGLVLVEAMSCSLPAIGFKNALAVNELIKHEKTGFLCEDEEDFGAKLELLMSDENMRANMGAEGKKSVEIYSEQRVWQKWERLFSELNGDIITPT